MTVKELKEALDKLPDNLEVQTSDWNVHKLVRGVDVSDNSVILRLYLTNEEYFEEERRRNREYWSSSF